MSSTFYHIQCSIIQRISICWKKSNHQRTICTITKIALLVVEQPTPWENLFQENSKKNMKIFEVFSNKWWYWVLYKTETARRFLNQIMEIKKNIFTTLKPLKIKTFPLPWKYNDVERVMANLHWTFQDQKKVGMVNIYL